MNEWRKVGVCEAGSPDYRFNHAGLSVDGKLCFASTSDDFCFVWDIDKAEIIWHNDDEEAEEASEDSEEVPSEVPAMSPAEALMHYLTEDGPEDEDWCLHFDAKGIMQLDEEPVAGRYRIFGLNDNFARLEDEGAGIRLHIDRDTDTLILQDIASGSETARLPYEAFSHDWAFASFSDDGSTIAVLEPYYVTFFRRKG